MSLRAEPELPPFPFLSPQTHPGLQVETRALGRLLFPQTRPYCPP